MLTQKFWKKYFKAYDTLNLAIPYQELLDEIINCLEVKKGEIIFDAGSGTGNLSLKLKEKGANPLGMDFSQEGIKLHKIKDSKAQVIKGDLTRKLPFSDNYFNKIASNNVLYTIDPSKRKFVLEEFYRVLKPNGKIVIANIHKNFKPIVIFSSHLKQSFIKYGVFKTFADLLKFGNAIIKIFYYNYLIKKENKIGEYGFMENGEQKKLLEIAGFKKLTPSKLVYANQSYLDSGIKS